jgi:hypothetical protein
MKLPRVRFTVWQLMLAVAVVALMTPFPDELVHRMGAMIAGVWVPAIAIAMMVDQFVGQDRATKLVVALVVGAFTTSLLRYGSQLDGFSLAVLVLTKLNVMGPFWAAWRLRRHSRLYSGEVLWAWLGFLWPIVFFDGLGYPVPVLEKTAQVARMSLVVVLVLAIYGSRPVRLWSHCGHAAGWVLMECNVVLWAWYAWPFIR